jgi:LytS/YehU family sensor histidine kinase
MTICNSTVNLAQSDEGTVAFVLFIALVYLGFRYYKLQGIHKRNQKELMQQLISKTDQISKLEIESTRFQLNQHTFKNTLTTVKSLAEQTSRSIDILSEVLNYMVYDSNSEFVSPKQEIDFLKNFIKFNELQHNQIRFVRIFDQFSSEDPLYHEHVLPPMITAYFVENAFKHGLLQKAGDIEVVIEMRGTRWYYTTSNPINPVKVTGKGGVGIENMKRRLQAIFPHRHTFRTDIMENRFVAHLEVELKK